MSIFSDIARRFHIGSNYDSSSIIRNVAYFSGTDAHVNHKLDIFLPNAPSANLLASSSSNEDQSERKVPIILHVHGGGWVRGNRTNEWRGGPTVGRSCAKEGFLGIVVSYRLARVSVMSFAAWSVIFGLVILMLSVSLLSWQLITGYTLFMTGAYFYNFFYQVRVPVNLDHMVDDICRALVYIRDHIHEHCPEADPNQIFLSGHSAGAHLISLLVLDPTHFQRHNYLKSSIRGVITMSGIYTLANPIHDWNYNPGNLFFRLLYSSNLVYPSGRTMKEYSPIEYIESGSELPPFLVMSARFDMGLEVDARRFVEKFCQHHHPVEYHVIGGMTTHGTIASKFAKNDAHRHFFHFIRQHMKP